MKGRGSPINPVNRFEQIHLEPDPDWVNEDPSPKTEIYVDTSRSIITTNASPDVGFAASLNPYRGCEHGCSYCYARPTHEYLGLSSGLDFETKIFVKMNAAELLRKELSAARWKPQVLGLSGVTDCYQPLERRLKITRQCLEVLAEFRNPVAIITKNRLVTRDLDILKRLNEFHCVAVMISVTTLDAQLSGKLEPRASRPPDRLAAIRQLQEAGIPVGVLVAPVIPALTDHEIPSIIKETVKAGVRFAGYVLLRLPFSVKDIFAQWLGQHVPQRQEKILNRIRAMHGGKLYDAQFGTRMRGQGIFADQIEALFSVAVRRAGILDNKPELSTENFRKPHGAQLMLFD